MNRALQTVCGLLFVVTVTSACGPPSTLRETQQGQSNEGPNTVVISDSKPPAPDIPEHIKKTQIRGADWPEPTTKERVAYYEYFGKGAEHRAFATPSGLEAVTPELLALEDVGARRLGAAEALEGSGFTSQALPPELAFWYAVVDLFDRLPAQETKRGESGPATLSNSIRAIDKSVEQSFGPSGSDGQVDSMRRNASVYESTFQLDSNTQCASKHRLFTERDTRRLSLADRMNGFDPDESADENLGALYDTTGLSQEIYLALHGRLKNGAPHYDLRLFHAFELKHHAVSELHELSLECQSDTPLLARSLRAVNHRLTRNATGGVWKVQVRLAPPPKTP